MKQYLPVGVVAVAVVAIQLLTQVFGVTYYLTQLTMSAYYAVVALGLCMLMGYAGQISLGQAGFFAIGGYTAAYVTTLNLAPVVARPIPAMLDGLGLVLRETSYTGETVAYLSPWLASMLAVVLTVAVALLVGIPVLRLRGHYLAMATLGFGIIVYRVILGTTSLGAADGISNVPAFNLLPGVAVSGSLSARVSNYYVAWALVLLGLVLLVNLINSRVGRSLRALHGGEEAADSMGVDTARMKLSVFVLAAVFAAVAGVFMTHYNGGIGPSEASATKSVRYVAIVAVGGMANLWGTLTMAVLLNFLSLRGAFGTYDDAVFAAVLILIMLFAPDGFLRVSVLRDLRSAVGRVLASTRRRKETSANPLVSGGRERRSLSGHLGDTASRGREES